MAYIGNVPAEKYIALTQQTFSSPTGTSFTLSQAVTNPVDIDLYIDNVKQDPASYSVSGTSLTTSTIASPSTMYCIFNGKAMQTVNPPDDSVGLSQMASGTDGNVITFDASGNPAYVATGTDGQVLTSTGAGSAPAFETLTTGKVLQVVNTQDSTKTTGTTAQVFDDTIPTSSEGVVYSALDTAITAAHASNLLLIDVIVQSSNTATNSGMMLTLFKDSGSAAIASATDFTSVGTAYIQTVLRHYVAAGDTSAHTYKVRIGSYQSGTTTINGASGGRIHGGVGLSSMTITEIAV
tara:strand:+ start:102 stop:983 length:882 start_codon:yes stop_codon:yes gene_type:complete